MKCEVCGRGERREQRIRYSLPLGDKLLVVENVPAIVCDRCGETTLSPTVTERLAADGLGVAQAGPGH